MKLKQLKTKTVTRKIKPSPRAVQAKGFDLEADALGEQYEGTKEIITDAQLEIDGIKETVEALVSVRGIEDGNAKIVRGNKYCVGITDVMSSPALDSDGLFKHLSKKDPKLCKKLFASRVVYELDETTLIQVAENDAGLRKILAKFTTPPQKKHTRLNVSRL